MRFLPPDMTAISDTRLAYLDKSTERDLKREIDRLDAADAKFARALKHALLVEDEVNRRAGEEPDGSSK